MPFPASPAGRRGVSSICSATGGAGQASCCCGRSPARLVAVAEVQARALCVGEDTARAALPQQCPSQWLCHPGASPHWALRELERDGRAVGLSEMGRVCLALCEVLDEQSGLSRSVETITAWYEGSDIRKMVSENTLVSLQSLSPLLSPR